jgi:ABC-type Mn2+/Zn2+ transport system ATPase subunit
MGLAVGRVLLVSEVSKTYWRGGKPLDVLKSVSMQVPPAAIVAVVGERHEGKSTLLKIAAGIEAPDHGHVLFNGRDLWKLPSSERERLWGNEIAWTSRSRPGLDWGMRDYVGLRLAVGRSHGRRSVRARAVAALKRVGAEECVERRWGELSDWQRVLVGLACGIVSHPQLLVIDDLFDGLGISKMQVAGELLSSLAQEFGCGVLMSASGMEAALMADVVWLFGGGGLQLMSDQTAGSGEVVEFPRSVRRSRGAGS